MPHRVFLLSPARLDGRRAVSLLRQGATHPLAGQLRAAPGARLGEVYSFLSGLYFRGKLEYARAFAAPPAGWAGALIITPGQGLRPPGRRVTVETLAAIADVGVSPQDPRFVEPLRRDAAAIARRLGRGGEAVLLGSIATDKYLTPLRETLGPRLRFPREFVGRGDMSRGGLMLRCAAAGRELTYVAVDGVPRRGARPPRLAESAWPP